MWTARSVSVPGVMNQIDACGTLKFNCPGDNNSGVFRIGLNPGYIIHSLISHISSTAYTHSSHISVLQHTLTHLAHLPYQFYSIRSLISHISSSAYTHSSHISVLQHTLTHLTYQFYSIRSLISHISSSAYAHSSHISVLQHTLTHLTYQFFSIHSLISPISTPLIKDEQ